MRKSLWTDLLLSLSAVAIMLIGSGMDGKLAFNDTLLANRHFHGAWIAGGVIFVGLALLSVIARLLAGKTPPSA